MTWNSYFFIKILCSYRVLVECMDDVDADSLKSAAEYIVDTLQDPVAVVLGLVQVKGR